MILHLQTRIVYGKVCQKLSWSTKNFIGQSERVDSALELPTGPDKAVLNHPQSTSLVNLI